MPDQFRARVTMKRILNFLWLSSVNHYRENDFPLNVHALIQVTKEGVLKKKTLRTIDNLAFLLICLPNYILVSLPLQQRFLKLRKLPKLTMQEKQQIFWPKIRRIE